MNKSETLTLLCQLSHELNEWHRAEHGELNNHYSAAMDMLYKIQTAVAQIAETNTERLTGDGIVYA